MALLCRILRRCFLNGDSLVFYDPNLIRRRFACTNLRNRYLPVIPQFWNLTLRLFTAALKMDFSQPTSFATALFLMVDCQALDMMKTTKLAVRTCANIVGCRQ